MNNHENDITESKDIHILFALILPKFEFVELFLEILNEKNYDEYLVNNVLEICLNDLNYRSISCIKWLLYIGFVKTDYQYNLLDNNLLDNNPDKNENIKMIINKSKNNEFDNDYYKELLIKAFNDFPV